MGVKQSDVKYGTEAHELRDYKIPLILGPDIYCLLANIFWIALEE